MVSRAQLNTKPVCVQTDRHEIGRWFSQWLPADGNLPCGTMKKLYYQVWKVKAAKEQGELYHTCSPFFSSGLLTVPSVLLIY